MRQVANSLTFVLLITMALSFAIDDYIEGGVVTAVILLNICVGFYQDYKAAKDIESLKILSAPESSVLRDGTLDKVKAAELVPGDIVHLHVGSIVPADLRLIDSMNAATDEAFLTGESLPVDKTPASIFHDEALPTGDRTNLAFSGSKMTAGRCTGIVIATGMQTEVGKIAVMLRQGNTKKVHHSGFKKVVKTFVNGVKTVLGLIGTPLQVSLSKFALLLFALAILLAIIVFSANKWQVGGEVLIYGICVAVAVIPESLIAVLTITLAVGAKAMSKAHVIVREIAAIEAVGGVTNICSDKTGTLTQGRMITRKALISGVGTIEVQETADPYNPHSGLVKLDGESLDLDEFSPSSALQRFFRTIALCNLSTVEPIGTSSTSQGGDAITGNETKDRMVDDDGDTDGSTIQSATPTRPTTASSETVRMSFLCNRLSAYEIYGMLLGKTQAHVCETTGLF